MTTTTISGLPPAQAVYPTDAIAIDQSAALPGSGASKQATPAQIVQTGLSAALIGGVLGFAPASATAVTASTLAAAASATSAGVSATTSNTSAAAALASAASGGASATAAGASATTAVSSSAVAAGAASGATSSAASAGASAASASTSATQAALGQIASATATSGSLQLTLANGTQIAVPGSLIGPPGATGPASTAGTPRGVWNASTNTPAFASGGGGGVLGDSYVVGTAGATSVDGSAAWAVGDIITRGVSTWARIPGAGLALASASLSVPNATLSDTGAGAANWSIVDGFGNVALRVDGAGLTVATLTAALAAVSALTATGPVYGASLAVPNASLLDDGSGLASYSIVDAFNNVVAQFNASGAQFGPVAASSLAINDVNGLPLLAASSGTGTATLADMTASRQTGGLYALAITDQYGFTCGAVDYAGVGYGVFGGTTTPGGGGGTPVWAASDIAQSNARNLAASAQVVRNFSSVVAHPVWNYSHVIVYGQSLSSGWEGWPALSVTQPYDNLMLGNAVRPVGEATTVWAPFGDAGLHSLIAVNQVNGASGVIEAPATVAALAPGSNSLGETIAEGGVNFFRRQQLQQRGLAADPARLMVASSCGVGGMTVEQLSKGASPELFNRLRTCATAAKTAAGASSYGIAAFLFLQGEFNYNGAGGGTTDGPTYQAKVAQLYADFCSDVVTGISGQAQIPAVFTYQTGESYVRDTAGMGIGMAQLNAALGNPSYWYLIAPDYPVTDKAGHLDPNGYRWLGKQFGKVMHKVLTLGQGWLPLYPTALRIRGNVILVDFHVPEPPLAFDLPYLVNTATAYSDQGFSVRNVGTLLPVTSVQIVSDTQIEITLGSAPAAADITAGKIIVSYADQEHAGNGCLRDSDPAVSDDLYAYTAGNGQYASANIAALVGKPYPLQNWCVGFWLPVIAG